MCRWRLMQVDPTAVKGNPGSATMSPAPASQSAGERDWWPTRRHLVPLVVPVLVIMNLAASMLMAEPVSQQSAAGAVRYLMRESGAGVATVHSAVCRHHGPDRLHPDQVA